MFITGKLWVRSDKFHSWFPTTQRLTCYRTTVVPIGSFLFSWLLFASIHCSLTTRRLHMSQPVCLRKKPCLLTDIPAVCYSIIQSLVPQRSEVRLIVLQRRKCCNLLDRQGERGIANMVRISTSSVPTSGRCSGFSASKKKVRFEKKVVRN